MAHFPYFAEREIRAAIGARRLVLVVGQRRSGVTHWVVNGPLGAEGRAITIDLGTLQRGDDSLPRALTDHLRLEGLPQRAGDLMPLLVTEDRSRLDGPTIVVCANAHSGDSLAIDWLMQGLLNPVVDPTLSRFVFCIEGAVDVEAVLDRCASVGASQVPLVLHETATSPWQQIVDVESFMAVRQRRLPLGLIPLLADVCQGDLRFLEDVLERLPEEEYLSKEAIDSAIDVAEKHGRCALELRGALRSLDTEARALALCLAEGAVELGPPPSSLRGGCLKRLYLAGISTFDPVVCGYRVRGGSVAAIVLRELGGQVGARGHQHALTAYLVWQTATVELALRTCVAAGDVLTVAEAVATATPWGTIGKTIKRGLSAAGMEKSSLEVADSVLRDAVPERVTVNAAAQKRLGITRPLTPRELTEGATLDELIAMATKLGLVDASLREAMDRVRDLRNAVAHHRSVDLDEVLAFSREARRVVQTLVRRARR